MLYGDEYYLSRKSARLDLTIASYTFSHLKPQTFLSMSNGPVDEQALAHSLLMQDSSLGGINNNQVSTKEQQDPDLMRALNSLNEFTSIEKKFLRHNLTIRKKPDNVT